MALGRLTWPEDCAWETGVEVRGGLWGPSPFGMIGLLANVATTLGRVGSGDGMGPRDLNSCLRLLWTGPEEKEEFKKNALKSFKENYF